jgi:hypothetical protein
MLGAAASNHSSKTMNMNVDAQQACDLTKTGGQQWALHVLMLFYLAVSAAAPCDQGAAPDVVAM